MKEKVLNQVSSHGGVNRHMKEVKIGETPVVYWFSLGLTTAKLWFVYVEVLNYLLKLSISRRATIPHIQLLFILFKMSNIEL